MSLGASHDPNPDRDLVAQTGLSKPNDNTNRGEQDVGIPVNISSALDASVPFGRGGEGGEGGASRFTISAKIHNIYQY